MNAELARLLREGRWVQPTSAAGVLGIGAAAFLLSYDALHSLALASGVRPGLARIWPGVLDGFIVVATLTVVAAKRASRSTWYPWALVVLFCAASVAFNILHALDQALTAAGWVAALVFAMPPVALVLATHLLLQQGVWRRQHDRGAPTAGAGGEHGAPHAAGVRTRPVAASPGQPDSASAAAGATGRPPPPAVPPPSVPGDPATRDRARQLYLEAQAAGRKLTGADLGRALGTSDSYGRLLLREFRTGPPASATAAQGGSPDAANRPARRCRGGIRPPRLPRPPPASFPPSSTQEQGMHYSCGDPACGAVGKHPLTPHGLKDASSDPAQLTGWWRRWPQANIGLVTGELADVLDVDGRPGRMALRRLATDHDLRLEGPLAETGHWLASLPRPYRQGDHRAGHRHAGLTQARCLRWAGLSAGQVVRSRSKNKR